MFARRIPLNSFFLAVFIIGNFPFVVKADSTHVSQTNGMCVAVAIDNSTSMRQTDPGFLRYRGARLFAALLDEDDQAALVYFNGQPVVIGNGLVGLSSPNTKKDFIDMIQPVEPSGYTDLAMALDTSANLLTDQVCSRKAIILLTDGRPELIGGLPSDYVDNAENLAAGLGFPVWGIALTGDAESEFLYRVAQASGGRVVPAQTASDLVDAYLAVLAGLKDRTILIGETSTTSGLVGVDLEAGLAPYVQRITLVNAGEQGLEIQPVGPGNTVFADMDPGFAYALIDDDFGVYAVDRPAPGWWGFTGTEINNTRVRAILRSSLRIRSESSSETIPVGEPLAVKARMVEESSDGRESTIIGDISFSAEIISPDGSQSSLDRLYDDGTHGDTTAGDGEFAAMYGAVNLPGEYRVRLIGYKGSIQAETVLILRAAHFPRLVLDMPMNNRIEWRKDPIQVQAHFEQSDANSFIYSQMFGKVIGPDGQAELLEITRQGESFVSSFVPTQEGLYQIEVWAEGARFKDYRYKPTAFIDVDVVVVPAINLQMDRLDLADVEVASLRSGIRKELVVSLSSQQTEPLEVTLAGFPIGLELRSEPANLTPGENHLYLTFLGSLEPGEYSGELILMSRPGVEISISRIPIQLAVVQPAIRVSQEQVDFGKLVSGEESRSFSLLFQSTSSKPEAVILGVNGASLSLSETTLMIPPDSVVRVNLAIDPSHMAAADYSGTILLQARPGLDLLPAEIAYHYVVLPVPLWMQALPFLGILSGTGLLGFICLAAARSNRPHPWGRMRPLKAPAGIPLTGEIDLSRAKAGLLNRCVVVGDAAGAGVRIKGGKVLPAHALIRVQRVEMMEKVGRPPRISPVRRMVHTVENLGSGRVLVDQRPVARGAASAPLKNGSRLVIGEYEFEYRE